MDILTAIFGVFSKFGTWIVETIPDLLGLFWKPAAESGGTGSLTFLGILAVCGLAMSVIFLLVGLIQRFLHFGG